MTPLPNAVQARKVAMYARLPQRIWPKNYRAPADGVHKIEPTDLFVVSVGPGPDGDDLFWVNAIGESGRTMTGDICYTKAGITQFIETEYGITPQWEQV